MKKLFFWTCAVFLIWSYANAADAPTASAKLTEQQATFYKTTIDKVLNIYLSKKSPTDYTPALLVLKTKIQALQASHVSSIQLFVLWYLLERVDAHLWNTTTPASNSGTASAYPLINVREFERGPSLLLWWIQSFPVSQFVVTAQLEDMIMQEFTVTSNVSYLDAILSSIRLYDANGKFIAEQTPQGWGAVFTDMNYFLKQWSQTLYLVLVPHAIGAQKAGLQKSTFSLHHSITKARGVTSQQDVRIQLDSISTEELTVAPSKITSLFFVPSFGGRTVQQGLVAGAENLLGIIKINARTQPNSKSTSNGSLSTVLKQFIVTVQDNTQAGTIASSLILKRINWRDQDGIAGTVVGSTVTFDLTQLDNEDNVLQDSQDAWFALSAIPTLNTTSRESVRLGLGTIDDWWVIYSTDDPAAQNIDGAFVWVQTIDGPLIIEN